ncbi:MAG: sigma-54 dependent transcriptional regulator [Burkholderiales bacterium]|nr:sigma-54 dependent transcriptional regulator [Burkholderiales bacterium]
MSGATESGAADARPLLLVVDDDALVADSLAFALGADYRVRTAGTRAEAIDLVRRLAEPPQLALVDLGLPPAPHDPEEGFRLIEELLAHSPRMRIVVLSGQSEAAHARHARALGAIEFVAKPCEPDALRRVLARALAFRAAELRRAPAGEELIGQSPALVKLKNQIAQFADSPFPVLIEGPSGSGKELVARSLHRLSARAGRPFLALNCAAIAPTLVEAALFGYVKGAFTGASAGKSGYFEDAGEGTLLLDEIGELPLELQPKLLRVLENGEFQRVGETQVRVARARVLAATNRDLRQRVREGAFRADLYHRLSVLTLAVPALRDMDHDRLLLLELFRRFYAAEAGVEPFRLDPAAEALWCAYSFPGNVRELRNIVIRLTARYAGREVGVAELEPELDIAGGDAQAPADAVLQALRHLERAGSVRLDDILRDLERAYVEAALRLARGNVSQAARRLGVNRTTLYSRMGGELATRGEPLAPPRRP